EINQNFKAYQHNQEKKMNQFIAAHNRLPLNSTTESFEQSSQKQDFLNFLKKGISQKGLSSTDKTGQFLIPNMIVENIEKRLHQNNSLRSIASVCEITNDVYEMLINEGEATSGWVSETAERNETHLPEILKLKIPTHEIYAKPKASQKLLDDSFVNLEEWILNSITETIGIMENEAFIKGDGIGKPKGILSYADGGEIENIISNEKGILKNADIFMQTVNALETHYLNGACWVMSRSALSQIRLLKDMSSGHYLLQPSLSETMPTSLLGFPVFLNDAMDMPQSDKTSLPILFGHFKKGYQIVDRCGMSLLRDPFSSKPFVEFYATKRVGGDVVDKKAIKAIRLIGS
nr:phage major capsid protein [Pseudomonadota bacterium]